MKEKKVALNMHLILEKILEDPNVQLNSNEGVYAFKFPTTQDKYNYTIAFLNTSGTDADAR